MRCAGVLEVVAGQRAQPDLRVLPGRVRAKEVPVELAQRLLLRVLMVPVMRRVVAVAAAGLSLLRMSLPMVA